MNEVAVRFQGIPSDSHGVLALNNVSLDIPLVRARALCGNGAREEHARQVAGIHVPDAGRVVLNGRAVHARRRCVADPQRGNGASGVGVSALISLLQGTSVWADPDAAWLRVACVD
jgi:hypothetical protein